MRVRLCSLLVITACASRQPGAVLAPQAAIGPAAGPAGRVLVLTASCGGLEAECRASWAPAVDAIVTGSLDFHGYVTIDPASLRKDERQRHETITTTDDRVETNSSSDSSELGIVGIFPVASVGSASSSSVTVTQTNHKTIELEGATFEDLRLEDRAKLMQLAGADSVLTTRVIVGANYSTWSQAQVVEVVIKLAAADSGEMRWSTRCAASSGDYASVDAAIEGAARCAAGAFTGD
jgi:hypothetical protein